MGYGLGESAEDAVRYFMDLEEELGREVKQEAVISTLNEYKVVLMNA